MNQSFPAVVRNVTPSGVFFEIANSFFGVIRRKLIQDGFYDEPNKLGLIRGQTIFVSAVDLTLNSDEDTEGGTSQLKRYFEIVSSCGPVLLICYSILDLNSL